MCHECRPSTHLVGVEIRIPILNFNQSVATVLFREFLWSTQIQEVHKASPFKQIKVQQPQPVKRSKKHLTSELPDISALKVLFLTSKNSK